MSIPTYKIIQLDNGDIALAREDSDELPVVTIHFSKQAKDYLNGADGDVATQMIEAGIRCVEDLVQQDSDDPADTGDFESDLDSSRHVIH